jgi:hypothetical protein
MLADNQSLSNFRLDRLRKNRSELDTISRLPPGMLAAASKCRLIGTLPNPRHPPDSGYGIRFGSCAKQGSLAMPRLESLWNNNCFSNFSPPVWQEFGIDLAE